MSTDPWDSLSPAPVAPGAAAPQSSRDPWDDLKPAMPAQNAEHQTPNPEAAAGLAPRNYLTSPALNAVNPGSGNRFYQDAAFAEIAAHPDLSPKGKMAVLDKHQRMAMNATPSYADMTQTPVSGLAGVEEKVAQAGQSAAKGVAQGTVNFVGGVARYAPLVASPGSGLYSSLSPYVDHATAGVNNAIDQTYPTAPTIVNQSAHAAGGLVPFLAAEAAAPGIGGIAYGGGSGAGQRASDLADRTDISPAQREAAIAGSGAVGAATGAVRLPIASAVGGPIGRAVGNVVGETAGRYIGALAGQELEAPLLNAGSTIAENAVSRYSGVKPDQGLLEGAGHSAAIGAITAPLLAPMTAGHEKVAADQQAASQESLRSAIAQHIGAENPDTVKLADRPMGADGAALKHLEKLAPAGVQYFNADSRVNGFVDPQSGRAFINVNNAKDAMASIVAHEVMGHAIADPNYQAALQSFRQSNPQLQQLGEQTYSAERGNFAGGVHPDMLRDEGTARVIEEAFKDPAAVARLARSAPDLVSRLGDAASAVLDKITGGNRSASRLLSRQIGSLDALAQFSGDAKSAEQIGTKDPAGNLRDALQRRAGKIPNDPHAQEAMLDRLDPQFTQAAQDQSRHQDRSHDQRLTDEENFQVDRNVADRAARLRDADVAADAERERRSLAGENAEAELRSQNQKRLAALGPSTKDQISAREAELDKAEPNLTAAARSQRQADYEATMAGRRARQRSELSERALDAMEGAPQQPLPGVDPEHLHEVLHDVGLSHAQAASTVDKLAQLRAGIAGRNVEGESGEAGEGEINPAQEKTPGASAGVGSQEKPGLVGKLSERGLPESSPAAADVEPPRVPNGAEGRVAEGAGRIKAEPAKTSFSRAALERKLLAYHEESGGGYTQADADALEQSGGQSSAFVFYKKLPGEVKHYIESNPAARRLFRVSQNPAEAKGEDAMANLGDRYWQIADARSGSQIAAAKETARKSGDATIQFWNAVHDNLPPPKERPAQLGVDLASMREGTKFKLNGSAFQVVTDGDGFRVLRDGDDYPETPVDALAGQKIPVDRGSIKNPKRGGDKPGGTVTPPQALPRDEIPFSIKEEGTEARSDEGTQDKDLFGRPVYAPQGNQQGGLFHEPTAPAETPRERVGSKNANNPENTGKLFSVAPEKEDETDGVKSSQTDSKLGNAGAKFKTLIDGARDAARKLADELPSEPQPATRRVAGEDAAYAAAVHANARTAGLRTAATLVGKVFGAERMRDPEAMRPLTTAIMMDNILDLQDRDRAAAMEARNQGRDKDAEALEAGMMDRAYKHPLQSYERDVLAIKNDPKWATALDNWKQHVHPELDQLYNEAKAQDPNLPQPTRGKYLGARINLLAIDPDKPEEIGLNDQILGKAPEKDAHGKLTNVDVKRDRWDRRAQGLGQYSTDAQKVLETVLGTRLNEVTKQRYFRELEKGGAAKFVNRGDPIPQEIKGEPVQTHDLDLPETDENGRTRLVPKTAAVANSVYPEFRRVINTDLRAPNNPVLHAITWLQTLSPADLEFHLHNQLGLASNSPGAGGEGGVWKDVVRKIPYVGTIDGARRIVSALKEVWSDTPEIREELSGMAKQGLLRPESDRAGWLTKVTGHDIAHEFDTATRLVMNRFYDNLQERGATQDTSWNRYRFVNQVGQYNRRLMSWTEQAAKDYGLSPFLTAGRNFNRVGRRMAFGDAGFKAADTGTAIKYRVGQIAGGVVAANLVTMMLNTATTGRPMGRSGTPYGSWDTGKDDDNGNPIVHDLLQLNGLRRGLRSTGIDALANGLLQHKDANTIAGNALNDVVNSAVHPFIGPGAGFAVGTFFGRRADLRGKMEAHVIPGGGIAQTAENARAALESQNPLAYNVAKGAAKVVGLDRDSTQSYGQDLAGAGKELASSFLKSPASALGIKAVRAGTDSAEDMAANLAKMRMPEGTTEEDEKKMDITAPILSQLRRDPDAGKAALEESVAKGELNERQAASLTKKAGMSPLLWHVRSLPAADALKVFDAGNDDEKKSLLEEVGKKVVRGEGLNADEKSAALEKVQGEADRLDPVAGSRMRFDAELNDLQARDAGRRKAQQLIRQAQDAFDADNLTAAREFRQQAREAARSNKLSGADSERLDQLRAAQSIVHKIEARVKTGVVDGDTARRQIQRVMERVGSGQLAA